MKVCINYLYVVFAQHTFCTRYLSWYAYMYKIPTRRQNISLFTVHVHVMSIYYAYMWYICHVSTRTVALEKWKLRATQQPPRSSFLSFFNVWIFFCSLQQREQWIFQITTTIK